MDQGNRLLKWLADHLAFEFLWEFCKWALAAPLSVALARILSGAQMMQLAWWETALWIFVLLITVPGYLSAIGVLPKRKERIRSLEDIFISLSDLGPTIIMNQYREDIVGINIRVVNRWPIDLDPEPMPLDISIEGRNFGSVSIEPGSPRIRAGEHCQYYYDHKNLTPKEVEYIKSLASKTTCLALRANGKFRFREKSHTHVKVFSLEMRTIVSLDQKEALNASS